jgi:hypothetical protein
MNFIVGCVVFTAILVAQEVVLHLLKKWGGK